MTAEPLVALNGTVLRENEDYVIFGDKTVSEPGDYVLKFWDVGDYTGSISELCRGTFNGTIDGDASRNCSRTFFK